MFLRRMFHTSTRGIKMLQFDGQNIFGLGWYQIGCNLQANKTKKNV